MFCSFRIRKRHLLTALCAVSALAVSVSLLKGGGTEYCTNEMLATAAKANSEVVESAPTQDTGAEGEKVAYLTFDDGPSETTELVLDVLKEYGVRATFFVCAAENNKNYLPTLTRTVAEGHQIGLHSSSHSYKKIYSSPESYWNDIEELKEKIAPYVGDTSHLTCLRFPGGSTNSVSHKYGGSGIMKTLKQQAEEKGYRYFDWNSCADDAVGEKKSPETLLRHVMRDVDNRKRVIVLMHDTKATKTTAQALPAIIESLRKEGYVFDVLENYPPKSATPVVTTESQPPV